MTQSSTSTLSPPQPQQQPRDYPAAHSMDTEWYAVDEHGELGVFDTGEPGMVPMLPSARAEDLLAPTAVSWCYQQVSPELYDLVRVPKNKGASKASDTYIENEPHPGLHRFKMSDYSSPYQWVSSPRVPLMLADLPEPLRNDQHLVFLKDYSFNSREPVSAAEHARNCYAWGEMEIEPAAYGLNFPLPNRRNLWTLANQEWAMYAEPWKHSAAFFAVDDDDHIALFVAHGPGACPAGLPASLGMEAWKAFLHNLHDLPATHPLNPFGSLVGMVTAQDVKFWRKLNIAAPVLALLPENDPAQDEIFGLLPLPQGLLTILHQKPKDGFGAALKRDSIRALWQGLPPDGLWWWHWLEYTTGIIPPRMFGFFHYAMTWHHAAPYVRIGAPVLPMPLKLGALDARMAKALNAIRFRGVRFAAAPRVQPFSHVQCETGHTPANGKECPASQIWIDEALTTVRLCTPESVRRDDDERLLRRARAHVAMVESLFR